MNRLGRRLLALVSATLLGAADKQPSSPSNYEELEARLRTATAQSKVTNPPSFTVGNFAAADNPQTSTLAIKEIGKDHPTKYVRIISNLGSERIPYLVTGNMTRAYYSGAAVTSPQGGPWSPFDTAPPIYPQSVRPDMAIGPPPELLGKQVPTWDVIPFNVRSGDRAVLLEYYNVDDKCNAGGFSFKIVEPPAHGNLQMGETQFLEPDLVAEAFHAKRGDQMDSRSKCQLTAFPAGAVQYTPTSGYVGGDNATVLINDHGYEGVEHFVFRVLPKPADAAPVSR